MTGPQPARLLFFLRFATLDRLYGPLLEELLRRGHSIDVVVEREHEAGGGEVLAELAGRYPALTVEPLARPADRWRDLRRALRQGIDYRRYLEPEYSGAHELRARAARRTPWWARKLPTPVLRAERYLPVPGFRAEIERRRPAAVLVSPLVSLGSPQSSWVRAARELGIPSVLPVASWDNLTNKGVVKEPPTLTVVWNEAQADEAVRFHEIPRERVAVSGAYPFDPWLVQQPTLDRAAFAESVGLPDDGPFLLYTGSSAFIAGDEAPFVREWLRRLRADERLRDVNVIVRPHPLNPGSWSELDDSRVVVSGGRMPTGDERRAAFFDALYHSFGVVGVSTSAFIEASIVGRPSFSVVADYAGTQEGTLHFKHVAAVLVVAHAWEEHLDQLAAELASPGGHAARIERFVESFVRPRGAPAAPFAADAIEAVLR